jgi:hypothetical protein
MHIITKERCLKAVLVFITAFVPTILNRENLVRLMFTLDGRFYLDLFVALLTSTILWGANGSFNRFLNRKMPVEQILMTRLIVQFSFSAIFTLLIVYAIYIPYSKYIIHIPLSRIISPKADLLVIILAIVLINLYYTGQNFFRNWKNLDLILGRDKKIREAGLMDDFILVRSGQDSLPIYFNNIAEIYLENKITYLVTFNNQQYILNESLNFYTGFLPAELFFRINRQHLVHRMNLSSFKSIENGKMVVQVKTGDRLMLVSQKSASNFRAWVKGSSKTGVNQPD